MQHDLLFENATDWSQKRVNGVFGGCAEKLGLDRMSFDDCLSVDRYRNAIQSVLSSDSALGVTGTPSIFINDQLLVRGSGAGSV